jgi:hypothetical protein
MAEPTKLYLQDVLAAATTEPAPTSATSLLTPDLKKVDAATLLALMPPSVLGAMGVLTKVDGYTTAEGGYDEATLALITGKQTSGWPTSSIIVNVLGVSAGDAVSASVAVPAFSALATFSAPSVTASRNATASVPQFSATATFSAPTVTAQRAATVSVPQFSATATLTPPTVTVIPAGAVSASVNVPSFAATATFTAATVTAQQQAIAAVPSFGATATLTPPTITAQRAATVAVPQFSATAAFTAPTVTGVQQSGAVSATVTVPSFSATATLTAPTVTAVMVPYASADSGSSPSILASSATIIYSGAVVAAGQSSYDVDRVDFWIQSITNNVAGISYQVEIWTRSGAALSTLKGTSNAVDGSALSALSYSPFTFAAPVRLDAGDAVVLTRTDHSWSGTNYVSTATTATDVSSYMYAARWNSTYVATESATLDRRMKLYGTVVVAVPTAPEISATGGAGQVSIALVTPSGNSPTSYTLRWGTDQGGPYPNSASIATTAFPHPQPLAAGTYYFVMAGVNGAGTGPDSAEVSGTATTATTFSDNGTGTFADKWEVSATGSLTGSSAGYSGGQIAVTHNSAATLLKVTTKDYITLSAGKTVEIDMVPFEYHDGTQVGVAFRGINGGGFQLAWGWDESVGNYVDVNDLAGEYQGFEASGLSGSGNRIKIVFQSMSAGACTIDVYRGGVLFWNDLLLTGYGSTAMGASFKLELVTSGATRSVAWDNVSVS